MLEFIEVPQPVFSPNACVCCMGINGPMVDTHRELPVYGHVYVCLGCVKRAALVVGLAEGDRMDELVDAAKRLHVAEQEVARHVDTEAELERQLADRNRQIAALKETNGQLAGRNDQLVAALKEEARTIAGVVGE